MDRLVTGSAVIRGLTFLPAVPELQKDEMVIIKLWWRPLGEDVSTHTFTGFLALRFLTRGSLGVLKKEAICPRDPLFCNKLSPGNNHFITSHDVASQESGQSLAGSSTLHGVE